MRFAPSKISAKERHFKKVHKEFATRNTQTGYVLVCHLPAHFPTPHSFPLSPPLPPFALWEVLNGVGVDGVESNLSSKVVLCRGVNLMKIRQHPLVFKRQPPLVKVVSKTSLWSLNKLSEESFLLRKYQFWRCIQVAQKALRRQFKNNFWNVIRMLLFAKLIRKQFSVI